MGVVLRVGVDGAGVCDRLAGEVGRLCVSSEVVVTLLFLRVLDSALMGAVILRAGCCCVGASARGGCVSARRIVDTAPGAALHSLAGVMEGALLRRGLKGGRRAFVAPGVEAMVESEQVVGTARQAIAETGSTTKLAARDLSVYLTEYLLTTRVEVEKISKAVIARIVM